MKKIRLLFGISFVFILGLLFTNQPVFASNFLNSETLLDYETIYYEDNDSEHYQELVNEQNNVYSDEELLQMSDEELNKLGMKEAVYEYRETLNSNLNSLAAAFSHKPGDILVTKHTNCKSGAKCTGITGHSGIVLNNLRLLHIRGPGYKPQVITTGQWYSLYKSTKVVRPKNASHGKSAATWANNYYVKGKGKNYEYDVRTTLNGTGKTYCSKLVWQAYKNGPGKNLVGATPGLRTPYDFTGYTLLNGHKVVRTVGW